MDIRDLCQPRYAQIVERAFERLEQALESGIVSRRKIPAVITENEYQYYKANRGFESRSILRQVYKGKVKVKKNGVY
jgi:hypothetical protein